jgi:hypothetical protein
VFYEKRIQQFRYTIFKNYWKLFYTFGSQESKYSQIGMSNNDENFCCSLLNVAMYNVSIPVWSNDLDPRNMRCIQRWNITLSKASPKQRSRWDNHICSVQFPDSGILGLNSSCATDFYTSQRNYPQFNVLRTMQVTSTGPRTVPMLGPFRLHARSSCVNIWWSVHAQQA